MRKLTSVIRQGFGMVAYVTFYISSGAFYSFTPSINPFQILQ
ncbi:hypothetical protein ACFPFV_07175 [Salinicoccus siamensis]